MMDTLIIEYGGNVGIASRSTDPKSQPIMNTIVNDEKLQDGPEQD
jgi:hypothetical protein